MSNELTTPAKPTKLLIEKNDKDEVIKGRVEDATLLYVRLQDGELALNSETDINLTVQVAVTEDTAKNWKATFPKNGCREVPNEAFARTYKTDPPYPEESMQHVLRMKSRGTYQQDDLEREIKAGDIIPYDNPSRPKLYEVRDGKPVDVTKDIQPANGSRGTVAFRTANNKYGTFPILSGVLVTELIESQRQANIASDFGITEDTPSTNRLPSDNVAIENDPEDEVSDQDSDDEWV
jgi:hypothetical protein